MAKFHPYQRASKLIDMWAFHCPGCKYAHALSVRNYTEGGNPVWTVTGEGDSMSFSPSLLMWASDPSKRCHSFIREGRIEFLQDCFHELAGQTVDIPDWKR